MTSVAVDDASSKRSLKGEFAFEQFNKIFENECIPSKKLKRKELLGEGGFAKVYKCALNAGKKSELVAEKELKPELLNFQSQDVRTFFAETRLLRKLDHPNVVKFRGVVCHDENVKGTQQMSISLVQEFMDCGSLDEMIKDSMRSDTPVYTRREALEWMIQVGEGLQYIHGFRMGTIIHRDLKPANILLVRDPERKKLVAKIADFGLSALVGTSGRWSVTSSGKKLKAGPSRKGRLRKEGSNLLNRLSILSDLFQQSSKEDLGELRERINRRASMGTVHDLSGRTGSLMYMAPEVLHCEKYNEKVDVFAFAMVVYEVMRRHKNLYAFLGTGSNPRLEVEKYTDKVANGFRPPSNKELPDELNDLIEECWADAPGDRPCMVKVIERLRAVYDAGFGLEEEEVLEGVGAQCACCAIQ